MPFSGSGLARLLDELADDCWNTTWSLEVPHKMAIRCYKYMFLQGHVMSHFLRYFGVSR